MPHGDHREIVLDTPRPLNDWERGVLARVLSHPSEGREIAAVQAAETQVTVECMDCPYIEMEVREPVPLLEDGEGNPITADLPCELHGRDVDGMDYFVEVHLFDGRLYSFRCYRGDFEPWRSLPSPAGLELICKE